MLAVGLPLSEFLSSLAQFFIGGYWLLEGNFIEKWRLFKERKSILLIVSIFLIHIIGLAWTQDFHFAMNDLRIKLPLLLMPIFVGTSKPLELKQLKIIFQFLIASTIAGSFVSIAVLLGWTHHVVKDIRDISIFISHIRFSLLINMAIIIMLYFLLSTKFTVSKKERFFYIGATIWLLIFLFILKSFTGLTILGIVLSIMAVYWSFKKLGKTYIILIFLTLLLGISALTYLTFNKIHDFYNLEKTDITILDVYTKNGTRYTHNIKDKLIENGYYINIYVCEKEMIPAWNKRSKISYNSYDKKGNFIRFTLVRYLTSLGLRKDAEGISKLSEEDIKNIETGYANFKYCNNSISKNIYEFIWQIDYYLKGGNPSGHSITQRLEYLKAGIAIIKDNFWFGIGTGDLDIEFAKQYNLRNSPLDKDFRLRAHNQYVTFFLTFGIIGFLLIMFAIFASIIIEKAYKNYIFVLFFLIALLSMINEDTLESAPGMSFFIFFFSLFVFSLNKKSLLGKD